MRQFVLALLFCITSALIGCVPPQPSVYLPTAPQVPLLKHEGELRATWASNTGSNRTGKHDDYMSLEAAYAAGRQLGLLANVAYSPSTADSNNTAYFYAEAGAGYHDTLQRYGRFEAYGGMGLGHLHSKYMYDHSIYEGAWSPAEAMRSITFVQRDVSFIRPFVQASLGIEGDVAAIAFAMRASYLSVSHLRSDSSYWGLNVSGTPPDTTISRLDTTASLTHSDLFLEPELMFRIGYQHVKLALSSWWSYPVSKDPPFLWADVNFSIGLSIDLDP